MQSFPQWKPNNHVVITYRYEVEGHDEAKILQAALSPDGNIIGAHTATPGYIENGTGTVQTKVTLVCGDLSEPSRTIAGIRYRVVSKAGNVELVPPRIQPVDFTVSCTPPIPSRRTD